MDEKTQRDAFGVERSLETGKPVPVEVPVEIKKEDKPADAAAPAADADIEKHPFVVGLKQQIDSVKKEMGGNLSAQREIIDALNNKLKKTEKGEGGEGAFVFDPKAIKRVKDLPEDEQEGMTATEKRLFDESADMKERMNAIFADSQKKETEAAGKKEGEAKVVERENHVGKAVQAKAKELAGDDTAMANRIIEAFNGLKFNTEGLSDEDIAARVTTAAGTIKEYKAPSEQTHGGRGKAADGAGKKDDPYGVDKIVEEASAGHSGTGFSL